MKEEIIEITSFLKEVSIIGTLFSFSSFIIGFLVWNLYLDRLGFSEYELIYSRFTFTGAVFIFFCFFIFYLFFLIMRFVQKDFFKVWFEKFSKRSMEDKIFSVTPMFIVLLVSYSFFLFPYISYSLGGGQPRVLSVIGNSEYIEYLGNFGIKGEKNGDKKMVQTELLCVAYENNNEIIILLEDRIIKIRKEDIEGFVSLPNKKEGEMRSVCSNLSLSHTSYRREILYND
ncbi:MAG: hypothetical protein PHZ25_00315 [Candidatus Pacebacteria bacterium]|nr:hypothetical protein [Candidatus Paceibacterota bacterium]